MSEALYMIVNNMLIGQRRDIHIYHHSTRSSHIVSDNSAVVLELHNGISGDFFYISVVKGPGDLNKPCYIDLPNWMDIQFSSRGDVLVSHPNGGDRLKFRIPPGPAGWEIKAKIPPDSHITDRLSEDEITISEDAHR